MGPPVDRVMLVGRSAGGLSNLLAADAPGVVGYVSLDPFDPRSGSYPVAGVSVASRLHCSAARE